MENIAKATAGAGELNCALASGWKTDCRNLSKKRCTCRRFPPTCSRFCAGPRGAAVEHLSERFFRCMRREECDRIIDIVKELGAPAQQQLREMLRTGQPRQAASVVGLLSRLDVPSCWSCCQTACRSGTASITTWWCARWPTARPMTGDGPCWNCWKFLMRWSCRRRSMKLV